MDRFKFRFQRVLDVKERREELLRQQMAARERELRAARAALSQAEERLAAQAQALRTLFTGRVSVDQVSLHAVYVDRLRRETAARRAELERARSAFEESRGEVLAAMTERKGLELLKENDWKAFRRFVARREQRSLDEMAHLKSLQRKGTGSEAF